MEIRPSNRSGGPAPPDPDGEPRLPDGDGEPGLPTEPADSSLLFLSPDDEPEFPREPGAVRRRPNLVFLISAPVVLLGGVALAYLWSQGRSPAETVFEQVPLNPVVARPVSAPGLTRVGEEELVGPVGSTMEVAVRVTGFSGMPLTDSVVAFEIEEGEGVLSSSVGLTDAEGVARIVVLLPDRPMRVGLSARVPGSDLPAVRFEITAGVGSVQRVVAVSGDGQQATVGDLLGEQLVVLVTDGSGNPVIGAQVQFEVTTGGGLVAPSRIRTDFFGQAAAIWRLGATAGEQLLAASVPDANATVAFTASAISPADVEEIEAGTGAGVEEGPADATGPVTVVPRPLAVGGNHICELSRGRVSCRGANDRGQRGSLFAGVDVAITAGLSHSCTLDEGGTAFCWGANDGAQLGDGTRRDITIPMPVATELRFSALTAGAAHTCGLAAGGVGACWGQNLNGQLGDGSREDRGNLRIIPGARFKSLVAGWNHTCGLTMTGDAQCWGLNGQGQLGDGTRLDRLTPISVGGPFDVLVAGSSHTCVIRRSEVLCWGSNNFGQLGDGTTENRPRAVVVVGLPGAPSTIAAGAVHTCALLQDGSAHCWGQNLYGQLGDGSTENRSRPSPVAGSLRFRSLFAGGAMTCGYTADGAEYCWGMNQDGQLGDGTRTNRSAPVTVTAGLAGLPR